MPIQLTRAQIETLNSGIEKSILGNPVNTPLGILPRYELAGMRVVRAPDGITWQVTSDYSCTGKPAMKFTAIHLHTTGRDPTRHQVIEIGLRTVVLDIAGNHVTTEKDTNCVVRLEPDAQWAAPAYEMHRHRIETFTRTTGAGAILTAQAAIEEIKHHFKIQYHLPNEHVVLAGKNVGKHDWPFLCAMGDDGWQQWLDTHVCHRFIDIGSMYLSAGDAKPKAMEVLLNDTTYRTAHEWARGIAYLAQKKLKEQANRTTTTTTTTPLPTIVSTPRGDVLTYGGQEWVKRV